MNQIMMYLKKVKIIKNEKVKKRYEKYKKNI